MKKFIGILVIVVILALIIVPRVTKQENKTASAEEEIVAVTVAGNQVHKGDLATYVDLIGNTYSNATIPVIATIPAEVVSINVEVGDFVEEGDPLFTLSTEDLEDSITQAKLGEEQANAVLNQANVGVQSAKRSVEAAQLAYDMAKSNYDKNLASYQFAVDNLSKYEELYNQGIVSETEYEQMKLQAAPETLDLLNQQLEQAKQGLETAQLGISQANSVYSQANVGVKQAGEGLKNANEAIEDMVVTAPATGYITAQNLTEKSMASNASAAMIIDELQVIKVTANVTANQVNKIKEGEKVDVVISANDKTYVGTVKTVGLTSNAATLLYPIVVEVPNKDLEIKPGMFATIEFKTDEVKNVMLVPVDAVVVRDGQDVVYVQDTETTAKEVSVETGLDDGYNVEIKSGLSENDVVITDGVGLINESTIIRVIRGDE